MRLHFHRAQRRAFYSPARFILVLAGTQSGKTSFGPYWLYKEIQERGAGDYLVGTPTFPLLELKLLPEFRKLFEERLQIGEYRGSPSRVFTLNARGRELLWGDAKQTADTRILFGHAQDPDSLESATAKAAWLDEAGQKKFKVGSYEAIRRRLSIHQGRILFTTTPYYLGWLKREIYDKAKAGDPNYDVIQFESTMNPAFPMAEFEERQATMPAWKFNMMYRGRFERPAGLIYDCFDEKENTCPPFSIPRQWRRHMGLDFGGVNTAAVFLAEEPGTKKLYAYRTYHAGSLTTEDHARALLRGEPGLPHAVGGAAGEVQWRREFAAAGLPVSTPPVSDIEVGIGRTYALLKTRRLIIFDDQKDLIDDIQAYARVLNENDEPTEAIEDKASWHRLDALRYICADLNRGSAWTKEHFSFVRPL